MSEPEDTAPTPEPTPAWEQDPLEKGIAAYFDAGGAAAESHPDTIGSFRILEILGQGGMGTVYLAEQAEPVRRRVAVKVIRFGMDTQAVLRRFEAERQALAMMEHSCIAKVLEAGTTDSGRPYFVMEYVEGQPITEYCDDHRLSIDDRLALFGQVCGAVQHAHQKGIIHRDIKPSNVLVTLENDKPVPKVIDFGLARATDHRLVEATLFTEIVQIIGTPEYMSPEQAGLDDLDIDTRTDIYSLGVILYKLLSGDLPFPSAKLREAGLLEMQRLIREVDPPKPSTRVSSLAEGTATATQRQSSQRHLHGKLRGDLDWIVMKALEKDRTRRYGTASDLASDVERHLRREVVLAGPPGVGYRLGKFVRRRRLEVIAGLIVIATSVAGAIGVTIYGLEATAKAKEASDARDEKDLALTRVKAIGLVSESILAQPRDPMLALLLAREAVELDTSPQVTQRLRDAIAGSPARPGQTGPGITVLRASFSPRGDHILTASLKIVAVWDKSWRRKALWEVPDGGITSVVFSPDGEQVAIATHQKTAYVWRWRTPGVQPVKLQGHGRMVRSVEFSHDSKRLVTASSDGTVIVWSTSGDVVKKLSAHSGAVNSAIFSPDDTKILSASDDGTARVWELSTTSPHLELRHDAGVNTAVYSPSGEYMLTASNDGTARLFKRSGEQMRAYGGPSRPANKMVSAVFSHDGSRILTAGGDGRARVYSLVGLELLVLEKHKNEGARGQLRYAAFSANSTRILTASRATVRVWDSDSGEATAVIPGHEGRFRPGSDNLIVTADGTGKLWDVSGAEVGVLEGHRDPIYLAGFMPGRDDILTASADGTIRKWMPTGELITKMQGYSVDLSRAGDRIVTSSASYRFTSVRDLSGARLARVLTFGRAQLSPDGKSLLSHEKLPVGVFSLTADALGFSVERLFERNMESATISAALVGIGRILLKKTIGWGRRSPDGWAESSSNTAYVYNLQGEVTAALRGHERPINYSTFSADGAWVLTTSDDRTARLWSTDKPGEVQVFAGHKGRVHAAQISPGNDRILTASNDHTARVWNLSGETVATMRGHTAPVLADFSPSGEFVLTTGRDATARIWDLDGNELAEMEHSSGFSILASFSPPGDRVLTVSGEIAHIWDLSGDKLAVLRGHTAPLTSAAFSPSGDHIVTRAKDSTVRLWDLDGNQLALLQHTSGLRGRAGFSASGDMILCATGDNTVRVWSVHPKDLLTLAKARSTRDFTPQELEQFKELLAK